MRTLRLLTGLGLATAIVAVVFAAQGTGAQAPQQARPQGRQPAFGEPVDIYKNNPYTMRREDGELHPEHVRGNVWILTGEPDEANVIVQLGDQGVILVDTGTKAMAPK